jgi:hypothetical protein
MCIPKTDSDAIVIGGGASQAGLRKIPHRFFPGGVKPSTQAGGAFRRCFVRNPCSPDE